MANKPKSTLSLDDVFSSGSSTPSPRADVVSFPLTSDEQAAYEKLFRMADAENKNLISPQQAVEFLSKSKLPQSTLSEIWGAADSEKRGFLTRTSFFRALKYIALAQNGRPISSGLNGVTPLPILEGITGPVAPHRTGDKQASASFDLTQSEKERFQTAFLNCKPVNATVSGESARDVFLKSGLPTESLSKIWNLVDTSGSGRLNQNQFMLAMYLISKLRSGALSQVPAAIPQELWNKVAQGTSPPSSPLPTLSRTPPATPTNNNANNSMSRPAQTPLVASAQPNSLVDNSWAVPHADRSSYGAYFDKLHPSGTGHLSGEEAYQFFVKSKLSDADLHRVWDLSNVSKAGGLTKDEFILAMFLINMKMAGLDLPVSLPPNLIPPSSKAHSKHIAAASLNPAASLAFPTSLSSQAPRSSITQERDLLSLGADPFSPRVAFAPPPSALNATNSMTVPSIGLGNTTADVEARQKDLANAKTQLADTERQLSTIGPSSEELRQRRAAIDAEYNQIMEQKRQQTVKLAQARAIYEAENLNVAELQESLSRESQLVEISRMELSQAEASSESLKAQLEGITAALNQARAEAAAMQKRVREVTDEANTVRAQNDALRNERHQQTAFIAEQQQILLGTQEAISSLRTTLQQETQRLQEEQKRANAIATQVVAQTSLLEKHRASHNVQMTSLAKERSDLAAIIAAAEHQKQAAEEALKRLEAEKTAVSLSTASPAANISPTTPATPASAPLPSSTSTFKSFENIHNSAATAPLTPPVVAANLTSANNNYSSPAAPIGTADDSLASFDERFPDISVPSPTSSIASNLTSTFQTTNNSAAPAVKFSSTTTNSAAVGATTRSPTSSSPASSIPDTPSLNGTAKVPTGTSKFAAPTSTSFSSNSAKAESDEFMNQNSSKKVAPHPPTSKASGTKSPELTKGSSPTVSSTNIPTTAKATAPAAIATAGQLHAVNNSTVSPTSTTSYASAATEPPFPPRETKPSKPPGTIIAPTIDNFKNYTTEVESLLFEANFDEAFKNSPAMDSTVPASLKAKKAVSINFDLDKEFSGLQCATVVNEADVFADDLKAPDAFTFDPSFNSTADDPFAAFNSKTNSSGDGRISFEDAFGVEKVDAASGGAGDNLGSSSISHATDDIEQMKTLLDMGYSREQAVEALEMNNYDLDKALEILIGAK